tara:strand:+ start:267 stop:620 length:354 start_codon:yes stop_codon:yes gene_type:complete
MNIVGPFPGQQFKVQAMATNRSRPSLSVNFNIPFEGLSHGMQVMHRAGFSVTSMNIGSIHTESIEKDISKKKTPSNAKANRPLTRNSLSKGTSANSDASESKNTDKKSQRGRRQRRK